jgi:hypothetical protein
LIYFAALRSFILAVRQTVQYKVQLGKTLHIRREADITNALFLREVYVTSRRKVYSKASDTAVRDVNSDARNDPFDLVAI